jgi:hypothetical protein
MGKGMTGFINPNWQKTAGQVVANAGLRAGAAVGSFWLQKTLTTPKDGQTEAPKYAKYVGPAIFAVGVAGEVFLSNPYMIAAAEGLTVAGGLMTAKMVLKEKAADYGLSGIGALSPDDVQPLPASVANFDFDAALAEANRINDTTTALPGMSGVYDEDGEEEGVNGASSRTATTMF